MPSILKKLSNYLWDSRNIGRMNIALSKGAIAKGMRRLDLTQPETWEFSGFSQNGEDGILDVLRAQLIEKNRYFIEIGSADGIENNTAWLTVVEKYAGLMIDGNATMVERARRVVAPYSIGVRAEQLFVTKENTDSLNILARELCPDVFSLDIDGIDYYIADAIFEAGFRPSIWVVEYNSVFGPERCATVAYDPGFSMVKAHSSQLYYGVSIAAWKRFFADKGYRFVTVDRHGVNAFFVNPELFEASFLDNVQGTAFRENLLQLTRFGSGHERQYELIKDQDFVHL